MTKEERTFIKTVLEDAVKNHTVPSKATLDKFDKFEDKIDDKVSNKMFMWLTGIMVSAFIVATGATWKINDSYWQLSQQNVLKQIEYYSEKVERNSEKIDEIDKIVSELILIYE